MPRLLDEGVGRIASIDATHAYVVWRTGDEERVAIDSLVRVQNKYEAEFHESAFEIPKFAAGTKVILGNGDSGRILEEVTGPTGFKSFRVQIENSANPMSVGRRVYATQNAMIKTSQLLPDVVVSIFKSGKLSPVGTVGCELAVDFEDQHIGLQKYSSLPSDNGMLFPYDPPRHVQFHMADVKFPIDVIFVDHNGRIAKIFANRQPGVDEKWASSNTSAVIEVNGGWCRDHGIGVGDVIKIGTVREAQEHFDPIRPDVHSRGLTDIRPPTDRFNDRQIPADTVQQADPAHFDSQQGFDPTMDTMDPSDPAYRAN